MVRFSRLAVCGCLAVLLSGCAGAGTTATPPVTSNANTISILIGDAQFATVGTVVPAAPTVLVQDASGRAVPSATVTFAVTSGGGSVTPATAVTGANGVASSAWTIGTTVGANVLAVSSADAPGKTLTATGTPDVPAVIRFVATDTLFLEQGDAQAQSVTLVDKYGNAVNASASGTVSYSAQGSTISVSSAGVVTGVGPGLSAVVATAGAATTSRVVGVTGRPSGNTRQFVGVANRPFGLAVSGSQALVTQLDAGTVTRLNISGAPSIAGLIAVGSVPTGISVTPNGATAFVSNQGEFTIGVLDIASSRQTKTFPYFSSPFRTLVSRDGSRAYGTTSDGELTVFNVSTTTALFTLAGFGPANGLALGLGDSTLYVSSMFGALSAVNVKSGGLISSVSLGGTLQDVVASPARDELYVADEQNGLLFLSPALTVTQRLALPGAFGVALTADGAQLWITRPSFGVISIVDRATRQVVQTLTGVGVPRRVAFDRYGVAVVTDEMGAVYVFR